jgi:hydroxypyruvate reductase
MRVEGSRLVLGDGTTQLDSVDLNTVRRSVVVGAGKAGAGMAAAVEEVLGSQLLADKQVAGWVNVPADCVRPLADIHLHAARPAGRNEPTVQGVAGSEEILRLVGRLERNDLCLCLLSGGGSALLPAPAAGVTLEDKLAVTRFLSDAAANIAELNTVRKQLSRIKGGGLLRACRAGRLVTLIISDVLGDPLEVIASGPTVAETTTPQAALEVLEKFAARQGGISAAVFDDLQRAGRREIGRATCRATNLVIGNNAVAVQAAGRQAQRLGYRHEEVAIEQLEGPAEVVGRHLAEMGVKMRDQPGPDCLISGGEPTVKLVDAAKRGLGGRNQ